MDERSSRRQAHRVQAGSKLQFNGERTMYSRLWQSSSSSRCSVHFSTLPRGSVCQVLNLPCTERSCSSMQ